MSYRSKPIDTDRMPPGIPFIVSNEAAERFSFYGMRAILSIFMVKYLWLMDSQAATPMSEAAATSHYHSFASWVYFTPLLGALLADVFLGKYRTIMLLSIVYCLGHAALACMGTFGNSPMWLLTGLILICLGAGGIKPCVSSHVGDQFGPNNSHLLTRIYNWFYFSINLGSFLSSLLTPWLLKWHGPHWAFGVPGVLMALATFMFWMGRHRYAHIPPGGSQFFKELLSKEGFFALAKLVPLFLFIAVYWSLYDQTGSSWVFQAEKMNRTIFGYTLEPSQLQALNPILILVLIPIFTFVIYPLINRVFRLTPLRKIGIGLFLIAPSFWIAMTVQTWIDAGQTPTIGWQALAYLLLTSSEVMVSIVGLEFAYTQAPRNMKSMIMALYMLSSFIGNHFTSALNERIQIPSATSEQLSAAIAQLPANWKTSPRSVVLAGYDNVTGTADDFIQRMKDGKADALELPGQSSFDAAALKIETLAKSNHDQLPDPEKMGDLGKDLWGNPIRYQIISSAQFRLMSDGPSKQANDKWNIGLIVDLRPPATEDKQSWLAKRKAQLGVVDTAKGAEIEYVRSGFCGGQTKLEGAAYFRFFTWLMFGTAVLFVPFALVYRPRTYLHDAPASH